MNLDNITNLSRNDVLRTLGLAPRFTDYFLPALGIFSAGAVIGATTALMFAPKSGSKLRKQIRDEMRSKLDEFEERLNIGGSSSSSEDQDKDQDKGMGARVSSSGVSGSTGVSGSPGSKSESKSDSKSSGANKHAA